LLHTGLALPLSALAGSALAVSPAEPTAPFDAATVRNLARQLAGDGITVNNLSPGLVATSRNKWRRVDAEQWQAIQSAANPMRRAAEPEEMAAAALLLCSAGGSFITGADVQATGGGHL